jgi:hypothetical protein
MEVLLRSHARAKDRVAAVNVSRAFRTRLEDHHHLRDDDFWLSEAALRAAVRAAAALELDAGGVGAWALRLLRQDSWRERAAALLNTMHK